VSVMYAETLHATTSSVTLQSTDRQEMLGQKPKDFQLFSCLRSAACASDSPQDGVVYTQRASSSASHGKTRWLSGVLVVGKRARAPVVNPPDGGYALYVGSSARRGPRDHEYVVCSSAP
jgi:hypothetical protein